MTSEKLDPTKNTLKSGFKTLDKLKGQAFHQMREKLLMEFVSDRIVQFDDIEELVSEVLEVLVIILDVSGGFCFTVDGMELQALGAFLHDQKSPDHPVEASINQQVATALSKGPVVIKKSDPLYDGFQFNPELTDPPRRIALFPFQTLHIPLGVIILTEKTKKRDPFSDHFDVLQLLTGLIAEKLEKIGLSSELKKLNLDFEYEVDRRLEKISATVNEKVLHKEPGTKATKDKSKSSSEMDPTAELYLKNIGVEIRTPLNGILGFAELIRENVSDKATKEKYIDIIKSCGKSLMKIVDDARTYAIIKNGKAEPNNDEFLLAPFMSELYDQYKKDELFKQRDDVELKINININGHTNIVSDQEKLKLVLTNLISNAIKFTDSGTIEFGCAIPESKKGRRSKSGRHNILFFVRDTGVGIADEYKPYVFDEFFKVEHEISQLYGGLGLGLTIAKALVELMGGELTFTSASDVGTEFYFQLPEVVEVPMTDYGAYNGHEPEYNWSDKNILIVEDDVMSVVFLREALKSTGAKISHTSNGIDAIDLISGGEEFDLVLMDIKLPGMTGYEATRQIKALVDVPVLAQTAYAMSDDYKKILKAGCDDYISKPINRKKLLHKMDSLLHGTAQEVR